ncbi:hypothetical protein ALC56_10058 [Trachymyrmex septentrionalis]|uniref:Uncharacterized protein n=1 Tax=Trachymyrmex septentrionalis TaxID=34720 RepID=A0A195F529_9HYME|nr:hypothetical protein ALC56_10058 [Trachymyrmex septentrionalis]
MVGSSVAHKFTFELNEKININGRRNEINVRRMSGKRTRSFKCAVHHRDREVCSENDFHLLVHEPPLFRRISDDRRSDDDATETATRTRTAILTVFLPCILCCASLPMRENLEELPTYLVHCTTCETSTSSCFL